MGASQIQKYRLRARIAQQTQRLQRAQLRHEVLVTSGYIEQVIQRLARADTT
jgi:hypothetical protein